MSRAPSAPPFSLEEANRPPAAEHSAKPSPPKQSQPDKDTTTQQSAEIERSCDPLFDDLATSSDSSTTADEHDRRAKDKQPKRSMSKRSPSPSGSSSSDSSSDDRHKRRSRKRSSHHNSKKASRRRSKKRSRHSRVRSYSRSPPPRRRRLETYSDYPLTQDNYRPGYFTKEYVQS